ncbi:aminotransferase class I/II-fold pyridoxal phosphate-dependent enzyme, partial [Mastigocoleus sp. MO_188.B34]|uniref:DegT/DnrJ/EryC1/StrS family aminotransferase n=1 Tax=Mastigocoleus sp. MO_188.B34 TaxID=3036635 RepID=UPI00261C4EB9
MMEFTKDFKIPDPVPQAGIEQAVKLMETGRMYRYNFHAEFEEEIDPSELDDELATEVTKLEYEFSRYIEHKYAIAVNSCGSALFMSLKAAGLEYQDKVFSNAFTFTAVPSSIVHAGGIPIYLECNSQYLIDVEDFKRKIKEHPDAKYFIASHMRGHVSDMEAIKEICDEEGIYLIEDCAHSLGAKWSNGKHVGHTAKIACFSSQSYKMLNSGEGGFIATSDERVAAYCILAAGCYEKLYKKHLARPF